MRGMQVDLTMGADVATSADRLLRVEWEAAAGEARAALPPSAHAL